MLNWYILAIIAMICYGIQNFLYKVSVEKKCNTLWTSFSFIFTVAMLSTIIFFVVKPPINNWWFFFWICVLNAIVFLVVTITRIDSLKYLDSSVVFLVIRTSTIIVVLFSLIYFRDKLSIFQAIGIVLAVFVVLSLARSENKTKVTHKNFSKGWILVFIAMISGAVSTIIVKFAAISVNILGFIALSYILNTIFTLGLIYRENKLSKTTKHNSKNTSFLIGFFIGIINLLGLYASMNAMSKGALSVIYPIIDLSFVVTIGLAVWIYKEKLTALRICAILLAIVAVILLGIH